MTILDKLFYYYDIITPFYAAVLLSIIFAFVLRAFLRDLDVPPGPKGLPFFGYWPFLKTDTCHLLLKELSKKYGDVFSFRVTGNLFIHLGSLKALREAHITKSDYFDGRFSDYTVLTHVFNDGVAFLKGEPWKIMRKFFLLKFKEFGMNAVKDDVSTSVYDSLKDTVEELHKMKGQPIQLTDLATKNCMMVIRKVIFNDQGITVEEIQELNDNYSVVSSAITSTNMLLMGNFAKYFIFPFMPNFWAMKSSNKHIEDLLLKVIQRHESEYDENRDLDLVDCYIKERNARKKANDPTAAYFTDRSLVVSLSQFVTDGVLTVGLTIGIFLLSLVERPNEQEKIYREILDVVGPDRFPTMEDKTKLPYTNAFIYEVMRFSDFFPLFPGLQCSKETTIQGYKVPKGAITLINFYAAHRNPETYENPDVFDPSRFLSTLDKPRADLPILFGLGKRSCMGEAFSMIQIFLFLATVVQNFRLALPKGTQVSELMFWSKERLQVCAYPRH